VVRWSWSSWNVWHSRTNEWKDETSQIIIIIIIIIDTVIKRHKCLGYRGAGGDVNQGEMPGGRSNQ